MAKTQKSRHEAGFFVSYVWAWGSFNFRLFVDHMLANNRIELLDLHLVRHGSLVLVRGVVVSSPCARHQLDFVSHGVSSDFTRCRLDLHALATNVCQNGIDPQLVNRAHALG